MNYGEMLLSKIIDTNDTQALVRFGINDSDFATEGERQAYRFIRDYAEQNRQQAPDYRTFVDATEITYTPNVEDSFEYITRQLKSNAAKRAVIELINSPDTEKALNDNDGNNFIDMLTKEIESIKIRTSVRQTIGKTLEELKLEFYDEYQRRKAGKSYKLWRTPFPTLNEYIGGLYSSDVYGVIAESGRGKSYLLIAFVDELLRQGANVLMKSYELKAYLWLSRLLSIITAREELLTDESNRKVGVPNKLLLNGQLDGEIEYQFLEMLDKINTYYPGTLYLQAKGDANLTRTLNDLERELQSNSNIDAVVIDPFYSLEDVYNGRNANKTTGGAAEQAARRFERIIGENDVVGIYAVQANVEKKRTDDDGHRELKLPTRDQVKTSKALLEIATNLFSFDSNDGQALIGIEKGRNGAEDLTIELLALMDYGVIQELETGEAAEQFTEIF